MSPKSPHPTAESIATDKTPTLKIFFILNYFKTVLEQSLLKLSPTQTKINLETNFQVKTN
jgi:hypothetical protein